MDWIGNLNRALEYIEENLTNDIDQSKVADIAFSSKYHFLRVFNMLTNRTLGEYIRERRLSMATKELMIDNKKVIDVSLKYRYESPEAFSRAFKKFHGVSPSKVNESNDLLAAPPLYFSINVKGDKKVEYRIEKKKGFKVTGPSIDVVSEQSIIHKKVPGLWQKCFKDGTFEKLQKNAGDLCVMGISYNRSINDDLFSYMVGIEKNNDDLGFSEYSIPELTWAIFPGFGEMPKAIQDLRERIYSEWFPGTNYIQVEGPDIEIYKDHESDTMNFEIWIPVKSK